MHYEGLISAVVPGSIADKLSIVAGDILLAVDDSPVQDIIDLSFALAEENITLTIQKNTGKRRIYKIKKKYNDDIGLEFESAVFDGVRQCANKCVFCFVEQMPQGMRSSLYVRDDDYRLSFLYGNFITLTNLTNKDKQRIRRLHLSPLYISVHTTNDELRAGMMNNKKAGCILAELKELADDGIEFHLQIVLCPGINDNLELEKTFRDLYALRPAALSVAVVPVGLTKYREQCFTLQAMTTTQANVVIEKVTEWQKMCRKETGAGFIYLADEFYIKAQKSLPGYSEYDDFPQLENGIGMVRNFLTEWEQAQPTSARGYAEPLSIKIICGTMAGEILRPLLDKLDIPNLKINLVVVVNKFFGEQITVTGLLTGVDILAALKADDTGCDGIIIPGIALRKGENVFLDGMSPEHIVQEIGSTFKIANSATDLRNLLNKWI